MNQSEDEQGIPFTYKKMTERDKLIEELKLMDDGDIEPTYERIADFILADRKRIVDIVQNLIDKMKENQYLGVYTNEEYVISKLETLKNAGIKL